jgi:hypothetical protein
MVGGGNGYGGTEHGGDGAIFFTGEFDGTFGYFGIEVGAFEMIDKVNFSIYAGDLVRDLSFDVHPAFLKVFAGFEDNGDDVNKRAAGKGLKDKFLRRRSAGSYVFGSGFHGDFDGSLCCPDKKFFLYPLYGCLHHKEKYSY